MDESIAAGVRQIKKLEPTLAGRIIYYLLPIRYRIIKINVDLVFKDALSEPLKKKFIQLIYSHWVKFIMEFVTLPFLTRAYVKRKIIFENSELFFSKLKNHKPVLLMSGHCGNFEIAAFAPFLFYKLQAVIVRRKQKNKFFNCMIEYLLKKYHLTMTNNPFELFFKLLSKGKLFLLLIDNRLGGEAGKTTLVKFFGIPAYTYALGAVLSRQAGVHSFFFTMFRNDHNQHVIRIHPEIDKEMIHELKAKKNIMQYYYQMLEKTIMEHPEQWLGWALKKWRIDNPNRYDK